MSKMGGFALIMVSHCAPVNVVNELVIRSCSSQGRNPGQCYSKINCNIDIRRRRLPDEATSCSLDDVNYLT